MKLKTATKTVQYFRPPSDVHAPTFPAVTSIVIVHMIIGPFHRGPTLKAGAP